MTPEIAEYLRQHGAMYTTGALRRQLITAGHDPAQIDAALLETEGARTLQFAEARPMRSKFWRYALGINVAGLVVATIWASQGSSATYAGAVPVVLGFFLLIGLGISGLVGRGRLGRGLGAALLVPVIFTVILTGACMAIYGLPTGI